MVTKFRVINFKFDHERFSVELQKIHSHDVKLFAEAIGVDESTLRNWRRNTYTESKFAHPAMSNFIIACNILDIDPRDFFALDIPEVDK